MWISNYFRQKQIENISTSRWAEILASRISCQNIRDFQSISSRLFFTIKIDMIHKNWDDEANKWPEPNNKKQRPNSDYPLVSNFYLSLSLSLFLSLSLSFSLILYSNKHIRINNLCRFLLAWLLGLFC